MPRRCAAFNCRGNYSRKPYSQLVSFPSNENERKTWIGAMPNNPQTLIGRKEIWICASHFDCDWVRTRGGKRPAKPPTIFPGVPKSCMKQSKTIPRPTKFATSYARKKMGEDL